MLQNFLDDINCPDRIPCSIVNGELVGEIGGGDCFTFNGITTDWKIRHGVHKDIDRNINESILIKIFEKLQKPDKEDEEVELRSKYKINSKRINKKVLAEIAKYEHIRSRK